MAPTAGPISWFGGEKARHQPCVADPQILLGDHHRQQRAGGRVGEDLRGPQQQHRDQDGGDADVPGDERDREDGEHGGARQIDADDEAAAVDPVGQDTGKEPEQQPWQALEQGTQGDQQGILGLRGDQQRPGRQSDAVTEIADPRRADEPPERRAHARRQHGLDESTHEPPP